MNFTYLIIPLVITVILVCAFLKKINILKEFSQGVSDGLKTLKNLAPTLIMFITAITMLRASGALDIVSAILSKPADLLGIPKEVLPLSILKTVSGGGSVALLEDIFKNYGPDSYIGLVASVIAGSTETTFYTMTLYYGSVGISKTKYTLFCALAADITGFVLAAFFVRLLI